MRLTLRAAGLVAIAVGAVTCTDAPTAPSARRGAAAHLGVSPTFSPTAARAYGALASMGIVVTQVHIALTAADGRLALDTTIQFPADQDLLTISLPVEITGAEETFTALIELLDATGLKLFAQTQLVTARAAALPGETPPLITLEYVGPGKNARTVTVSPSDLSVSPTTAQSVTATAVDASGDAVTDLLVSWTSSDPTLATVVGTGTTASVTALGRRGTVTITATTPTGITGSARVNVLSLATHLAVAGGDLQVDSAGLALARPFAVRVTDDAGLPVQGTTVAWSRTAGTGAPATATSVSDASGLASLAYTLGTAIGADTVRASLPGVAGSAGAVLFTARAISRAASAIAVVSGDAQATTVLGTLAAPLLVRVTDSFGNPVAGVSVTWSASVAGGATFAPATTVTDAKGSAQTLATLGATAGPLTITATAGGASASFSAEALAGAAGKLLFVAPPPDAIVVGQPFPAPVSVRLADAQGNAVRTAGIRVRVLGGGVTPGDDYTDSTLTDASGFASFTIPPYKSLIGQLTLSFSSAGVQPVAKSFAAAAGAPARLNLVQEPAATAASGVAFAQPPVVQLTDVGGNPVPGNAVVTVTLSGGAGTLLGTTSVTTAADGRATFAGLGIVGIAGTYTLQFASGALTPAQSAAVTLVAGAVATLVKDASRVADDQYVIPGARFPTLPRVRALDAASNPVGGTAVTFNANLGTVTATAVTDAAGYAQPTSWVADATEGTMIVTASAGSASPVSWRSFSVVPSAVEFVSQTTTTLQNGALGTPVSFTVQVMDSNRVARHALAAPGIVVNAIPNDFNLVPGSVTTATTDANGRATIGAIRVNAPAGTISFVFQSPTLPIAAASQPTTVVPGPATTIESPYPGVALEPLVPGSTSIQPLFRVTDGYNVPTTSASVSVTIAAGSCTLTSSTFTSEVNGDVRPAVILPAVAGGCVVRAAFSTSPSAETQLAIYAPGTTHVWRGGVSEKWDDTGNWFPVPPTSVGTIPAAAAQVLVPAWPAPSVSPRLATTTQVEKLWVQAGGTIDLGGQTLFVGNGGVAAPGGSLTNGTTQMLGTATLEGSFDALAIGQTDNRCGGVNATLWQVTAKTLDAYCATRVDSAVRAQTVNVFAPGGTFTLSNGA
ncbi:MAG: beta strand repeat-containing protein, partial [Gemmatimonadaceae bacterium]